MNNIVGGEYTRKDITDQVEVKFNRFQLWYIF